jgi:hypothetical protein
LAVREEGRKGLDAGVGGRPGDVDRGVDAEHGLARLLEEPEQSPVVRSDVDDEVADRHPEPIDELGGQAFEVGDEDR